MKGKVLVLLSLTGTLLLPGGIAAAADRPAQEIAGTQESQIYGSQLMEPGERLEYQTRMRAAQTAEERELLRGEHHQRMQERAKVRGTTLPDEPPDRGGGMGMGPGAGGMGGGGKSKR
jgi:hypothetical protein